MENIKNNWWTLSYPLLISLQGSPPHLQHSAGLSVSGFHHVELRRGRHGGHPLESSAHGPAGLPNLRGRSDGAGLHQIPSRSDHLGRSGCHLYLGYEFFFRHPHIIFFFIFLLVFVNDFFLYQLNGFAIVRMDSWCFFYILISHWFIRFLIIWFFILKFI